jgi:NAD(P) transhydrogenase
MSTTDEFDVAVIGTGPAGEGAAMQCSKAGMKVCAIERHRSIGGGCTHWGTIPSKALRHAVYRAAQVRNDPIFGPGLNQPMPSFSEMLRSASGVIGKQVEMRRGFYERNGVELIAGQAAFLDPHCLSVDEGHGGSDRIIQAKQIVIATGSRPHRPADIEFKHPRVCDSDTILTLKDTPRVITIYGAGVIGCEYTSIFRGLQCKVNLINSRPKLLEFLDDEIIDALAYHLRDQGVIIRHDETYEQVELRDDGVVLHLKSGKKIMSDVLLFAAGRAANTEELRLEAAGLAADNRGRLAVNKDYRTSVPHIFAVGDVIGPPGLASASYDQGRWAGTAILGLDTAHAAGLVPTGIYTSPEISSVGRTERELTAAKVPYEVGHALFRHLARAQITGRTVGMLKLLFHRETREVLGVHCFGENAAEIVHIGQAVMAQPAPHNTMDFFINVTFNYPTMAEAYRVAALNGLNRLF